VIFPLLLFDLCKFDNLIWGLVIFNAAMYIIIAFLFCSLKNIRCLISQANSVFLSQQISEQYFSACWSTDIRSVTMSDVFLRLTHRVHQMWLIYLWAMLRYIHYLVRGNTSKQSKSLIYWIFKILTSVTISDSEIIS
jgi:hypothetical protein